MTERRPVCPIGRPRCREAEPPSFGWRMTDGRMIHQWACETCGAVWLEENGDFSEPRARKRVVIGCYAAFAGGSVPPWWGWE